MKRVKPTRWYTMVLLNIMNRSTCFGHYYAHRQELATIQTAPVCGTSQWLWLVAGPVHGCRFERPVRGRLVLLSSYHRRSDTYQIELCIHSCKKAWSCGLIISIQSWKLQKYQFQSKSVLREPSCSIRKERRTDRYEDIQTDMTSW